MTDETILLSYDELGERLGIERESARQLVLRKRWDRRKGNDGKARIAVPLDALPADTSNDTASITSENTSVITVLTRHIGRLEQAIDSMKITASESEAERDLARTEARDATRDRDIAREAERTLQVQIEALNAAIDSEKQLTLAEREKSADLKNERDRWAAVAERAETRMSRPWWKRLAG